MRIKEEGEGRGKEGGESLEEKKKEERLTFL